MKKLPVLVLLALTATAVQAQGTLEDYKRAYSITSKLSSNNVVGGAENVRWYGDDTFYFSQRVDAKTVRQMKGSIDAQGHLTLAEAPAEKRDNGNDSNPWSRQRDRMPGRNDNRTNTATKQGPQLLQNHWMNVDDERTGNRYTSPDSAWTAYIQDDNVFVVSRDGKTRKQLSYDGTLGQYYSAYLHWSPDSRYIAVNRIRPVAQKRYVYYVESSPAGQLQPITHQQEYAKPGDELAQKTPCIFEVATGKAIVAENSLFPNPYDIWGPEWSSDSKELFFEYNERGHKVFRVLGLNPETGKVRTIIEETSPTFVNYSRHYRHNMIDDKQIIWMSERDNWNHLYLYDVAKAKVIRQITKGEWVVRQVLRVDEKKGIIYFTASGMNPDEDPYHVHYYRIGIDGKNLTCLTPENGNHKAVFNSEYTHLIDTYSRVDQAPTTVLRNVEDPSNMQQIACADISGLLSKGWVAPEVFVAPGRDGVTPMWGIIQRPTNFDPNRKYPIIEYIYAGPGDAYTPKNFQATNYYTTALAELGFIVVQLDAMGTSYRGKKFEEVCYKNLKDAGFPDRKAWIRAAAKKYPYMDADNVGIYGCSAGGQESTTAVLLHGDFYKAAYSACGCHDNRMDKIWWNEQWMGWPVDSSYIECSNVENAHLLERPLMLVVGELDDNVDPASTMQVADALIRAGKEFELVVIPGAHHTVGEAFGEHKRFDFFVRNLLGVTPPKWNEIK